MNDCVGDCVGDCGLEDCGEDERVGIMDSLVGSRLSMNNVRMMLWHS